MAEDEPCMLGTPICMLGTGRQQGSWSLTDGELVGSVVGADDDGLAVGRLDGELVGDPDGALEVGLSVGVNVSPRLVGLQDFFWPPHRKSRNG